MSKEKLKLIKAISSDSKYDRDFINKYFDIVFKKKQLKKLVREHKNRSRVLEILRQSPEYATMKSWNVI